MRLGESLHLAVEVIPTGSIALDIALVAAEANPANRELIESIVTGRKSSFLNTDFIL
jgi:hypothetical protein